MSEMYFEDHPTDPDKVIIRKPQRPRLAKHLCLLSTLTYLKKKS